MFTSQIELIIGPMFSGKTSALIEFTKKHDCLVVTTPRDNRYATLGTSQVTCPFICSHDGVMVTSSTTTTKVIAVESCKDISEHLSIDFTHILIDEAQFIKDPLYLVDLANLGFHIVCAGLSNGGNEGDCHFGPFGSVLDLISIADSVTKLTAKCSECGSTEAILTFPKKRNHFPIGGSEHYKSLCRHCL
eukprot:TRINITY_DN2926_c0_g1_i2.p1 TRINITY_DN2926_c0_g1~~TRINITY_DN2926_c0_g1_i2.p1  ORF type:complete len:190 (-),score=15.68 TRINITY_DN2926_c0_g1_i2:524-1093(-)